MEVHTAFKIIEQLQLSTAQKKELAIMLQGGTVKKRKPKTITVAWAKRDFQNKIRKSI
ncbi:hypothetical protein [Cytophaga sp. FL35]|uniref:hypothetical protein n=1 Tax=Cytophaga sp. FL35 TaxID=1904456 RepID=UPI001653BC78|nr:hypothetical protein [Cytophaga sp. FL35]MBC6999676.1 hypothetical protein [Cytophaga sp. FL35]